MLGHNFQLSALSAECQPFYNCCSMSTPLKLPYVSCLPYQLKARVFGCSPLPYLCCSWWQLGDDFSCQVNHLQECLGYSSLSAERSKVHRCHNPTGVVGEQAAGLLYFILSFLTWVFRQPESNYMAVIESPWNLLLAAEVRRSVCPSICPNV